jgi:TPR repeat protein
MPNTTSRYRDAAYVVSRGWSVPHRALEDAASGDVEAQLYLAYRMFNTSNKAESHRWYLKAAEQGNVEAMMNVATQFEHGMGCEVSVPEACKWYEEAAESSEADDVENADMKKAAASKLGLYYYGEASPALDRQGRESELPRLDPQAAVKWWQVAAELGDSESARWLGNTYILGPDPQFNGQGIQRDVQKAIYWFRKAAEAGNGLAAYQLAVTYNCGYIPVDEKEHHKWLQVAAALGCQEARDALRDYDPVSFSKARKLMRENESDADKYDDEECRQSTSNIINTVIMATLKCFNPPCDQYEKPGEDYLLKCGQCRRMKYCSKDCQRAHWKPDQKQECSELKKRDNENAADLIEKKKINDEECRQMTSNLMAPLVKCFNSPCDQYEKRGEDYFECGQCHRVKYCSEDCQRAHWQPDHKRECPELKKLNDENAADLIEKICAEIRRKRRCYQTKTWGKG